MGVEEMALRYLYRLSHAAADFARSRLDARIRVPVSLPHYMCICVTSNRETAHGKESD